MENKDKIVALVKFFALLIILIITIYLLYSNLTNRDVSVVVPPDIPFDPEAPLSESELKLERDNLVKVTPSLEENHEITSSSTSGSKILTSEEMSNLDSINSKTQIPQTLPPAPVLEGMTITEVELVDERVEVPVDSVPPAPVKAQVYLKPNSGISVVSSGIVVENQESSIPVSLSTSGTIFSINKSKQSLAIIEGENEPFDITTNSATSITINGKKIKFSDLKVADIIQVAGEAHPGSRDILAKEIMVVGSYQIIPLD